MLALNGRVAQNLFRGRRLGTIALFVLAGWILALSIVQTMGLLDRATVPLGLVSPLDLVTLAISLVVVVQIGRATHLPARWRWAPAWALLAQAVVTIAVLVALVSVPPDMSTPFLPVTALSTFVRAAVPIFLGFLAVVLAFTSSSTVGGGTEVWSESAERSTDIGRSQS